MINNSPQSFQAMEKTIEGILSDGKLDVHDIPNLVLLISQIYKQGSSFKNVNLVNIIKFTVNVIIECFLPGMEASIAEKLADASIDLLAMNVHYIEHIVQTSCCVKR